MPSKMRSKILILSLAALLIVLSVLVNTWSARVGISGDAALVAILAGELVLFVALIRVVRGRRV